jgi:hypothetical protein
MDYQIVKQLLLLRQGVIVPNSEIATKLANYELLTDSETEVLCRAGLTALLHIMDEMNIGGHIIDNLIWNNRKKCDDMKPVYAALMAD